MARCLSHCLLLSDTYQVLLLLTKVIVRTLKPGASLTDLHIHCKVETAVRLSRERKWLNLQGCVLTLTPRVVMCTGMVFDSSPVPFTWHTIPVPSHLKVFTTVPVHSHGNTAETVFPHTTTPAPFLRPFCPLRRLWTGVSRPLLWGNYPHCLSRRGWFFDTRSGNPLPKPRRARVTTAYSVVGCERGTRSGTEPPPPPPGMLLPFLPSVKIYLCFHSLLHWIRKMMETAYTRRGVL